MTVRPIHLARIAAEAETLRLRALAGRSAPSRVEVEALAIRRQALEGIRGTLSMAALVIPLLRLWRDMRRRRNTSPSGSTRGGM